ncbi:MAG: Ribosomal-protein-alanine acetyltransferase [Parcubacteria group bacterium GW2011_GWA2_45_14]|nr:MAG: Ribosomal-protein-alanine acetyltransferase [Parcubacteria group bacterium GW2011_GWA2_45_14]
MFTAKSEICVHIRPMIRRDMVEVLETENENFEFPWSEDDFNRCFRQRKCFGMAAEFNELVVGFMIYKYHKNRLHLLNFAVSTEFRRRGVGRQMVEELIYKLLDQHLSHIMLKVRETNLAAQVFFRTLGFRAIAVLRDFYIETTEDAYLMQFQFPHDFKDDSFIPVSRISRFAR